MDQHLEEETTYMYQITQTQVVEVIVISATLISFPPDSRAHSLRELEILMWRTTKSLDSPAESRHKHFRNQQVKIHNDLNYLLGYNFFERLTFIFMFYIKKHHLPLSGAKAKDKIPVETHSTIPDYVYSEIFSPHYI